MLNRRLDANIVGEVFLADEVKDVLKSCGEEPHIPLANSPISQVRKQTSLECMWPS